MLHYRAVAQSNYARVLDVVLCIIGMVGMVYTTTLTVNSWIGGSTPKAPGYCDSR
jgi:proton-coupled amino acid transporter